MINKNRTILIGQKEKEKGEKKRKKKEEKRKRFFFFPLSLYDDFLEASFNLNVIFIVGWPMDLGWIGWPVHQGLNRCIGSVTLCMCVCVSLCVSVFVCVCVCVCPFCPGCLMRKACTT